MSKRYTPLDRWLEVIRDVDGFDDARQVLSQFRDEVEREYADEHSHLLLVAFAMGIFVCWVFS